MATELYLIRHAEAVANVKPIIGGVKGDPGLTADGHQQATLLATWLRQQGLHVDTLYTSTMPRARETVAYIERALGVQAIGEDIWHELRPGEADGLTVAEWYEVYGGHDFAAGKDPLRPFSSGGESLAMFLARSKRALGEVVAHHPNQTVMVVTHAGVISASFYHAFELDHTSIRVYFDPGNASITRWRHETSTAPGRKAGWTLVSFNEVPRTQQLSHSDEAVPTPITD